MNEHIKHGRCGWPLAVFVLTWLLVVGGVYPNGDDIAHLSRQIRIDQFVPVLGPHWIPNRIVDMYGRTLLTLGVEWWYGILHPWTGMDFFRVYQLLSASVMAALTAAVFAYMDWRARLAGGRPSSFARITLFVLLLTLLSWRNQVHLMAYQLPAVLSFILLWELHHWVSAAPHRKPFDQASIPSICILSYLTAFSLEAYALLILMVWPWLAWTAWRTHTENQQHQRQRLPAAVVVILGFSAALQVIALLLVALFSERAKVTNNAAGSTRPHLTSILEGQIGWFFGDGRFFTFMCLASFAYWTWRIQRLRGDTHNSAGWSVAREELVFCGMVALASTLMVTAVSHSVKNYYFSHQTYPWGDLLLIGKLMLSYGLFNLTSRINEAPWISRALTTLALAVTITRLTTAILDDVVQKQSVATAVATAYSALGKTDATIIETGLNLTQIHQTIRPLPTDDSPTWFKLGYKQLFERYYNTKSPILFK